MSPDNFSSVCTELSSKIDLSQTPPDYYPLTKTGERFPDNNPYKAPRLTPRPDDDSLFLYGLLAGIARIEAQGYQALNNAGAPIVKQIFTTGGGAKNTVWQQIRQQYISATISVPAENEAAYGAAKLAQKACSQNTT